MWLRESLVVNRKWKFIGWRSHPIITNVKRPYGRLCDRKVNLADPIVNLASGVWNLKIAN